MELCIYNLKMNNFRLFKKKKEAEIIVSNQFFMSLNYEFIKFIRQPISYSCFKSILDLVIISKI